MVEVLRNSVSTTLKDASGTVIHSSEEFPGTLYFWIGGAGSGLSIIVDSIEPLLQIRDVITAFEFSEKVAAAAKSMNAREENVEAAGR